MAENIKDKLEDVGHKIADAASHVGHRVGEAVEKAADWTKEKAHEAGHRVEEATQRAGHKAEELKDKFEHATSSASASGIREHMDVYASCGTKVGTVDHVEGQTIKLTKSGSPDGQHHRIPLSWVSSVDSGVRLDRDHVKVQSEWQSA
ncbi:hypothetical protein OJF2_74570 [Aquisphaera giovannonii]|uniref:DUF2171 domain-containing protein n=1 Tax=Aquisphaera giovannonii TaxID=406548 RepID=A0A5B9WE80_9BACT|nr:DUF2171 domain-containing protein [Aquisphaera giovannonii]QEH38847.1 hypothetical protein OJF2_74570 [Aquisphaera giovannonii]